MHKRAFSKHFFAVGLSALVLAGCTLSTQSTDASQPNDASVMEIGVSSCTIVPRTCAEISATFQSNSTSVMVSCDETAGTFVIRSTGVPNYTSNQSTPNQIASQGWVVTLPLTPRCASAPVDTVNSRGPVGFMINGVPFYGPQDADGRDAVIFEGPSFDDCEGHADQGCSYHYHHEPVCVFGERDTAAAHRLADGHPPVIGYAMDGIAIYASESRTGQPSLDACHGHSDTARGYHYHASSTNPYLVGCYRGEATGRMDRMMALCTTTTMDAGVQTDAGPMACTMPSQCTVNQCPPGSTGCTCANTPTGMRCVPTCNSNTDCPNTPMGQLVCDLAMHICHP